MQADLPLLLVAGRTTVRVEEVGPASVGLESLAEATRRRAAPAAPLGTLRLDAEGIRGEAVVGWLHAAMDVLHSAAGSPDFFSRAARAVVDLADLDAAGVVILERGEWKPQAVEAGPRGRRCRLEAEPATPRPLAARQTDVLGGARPAQGGEPARRPGSRSCTHPQPAGGCRGGRTGTAATTPA